MLARQKKHRLIDDALIQILSNLRISIKSYPIFYILWFYLIRKNRGDKVEFFNRSTSFLMDGYQRSGNTFAVFLIKRIIPDARFIHHLHAIAPVKMAIRRNIPIFIIIRDPLESISSNYLMHYGMRGLNLPDVTNRMIIELMVAEWIAFYKFVVTNRERITVIQFNELIQFPGQIILKISRVLKYCLPNDSIDRMGVLINEYKSGENQVGSKLPSLLKEEQKKIVKDYVRTARRFKEAKAIYEEVTLI
jgi:hypothetical protein